MDRMNLTPQQRALHNDIASLEEELREVVAYLHNSEALLKEAGLPPLSDEDRQNLTQRGDELRKQIRTRRAAAPWLQPQRRPVGDDDGGGEPIPAPPAFLIDSDGSTCFDLQWWPQACEMSIEELRIAYVLQRTALEKRDRASTKTKTRTSRNARPHT